MDCAMQIDRRSLMGIFKSDEEYRMDQLIRDIEMNMSNNYKDNAQADFAKYEKLLAEVKASGKMKEKKWLITSRCMAFIRLSLKDTHIRTRSLIGPKSII